MIKNRLLLLVTFILSISCQDKDKRFSLFTEISSDETGVTFSNLNRENEKENIIGYEYFYNGGGVAAGDIDNDGLVDLFFTSNQGTNKLYLNKGNFKFEDITESAGVSGQNGWKTGAAMVDINADGLLDIYVCRSGNQHELFRENSFYINKGNLKFQDEGLRLGLNDNSYSTQAAFLDFDHDGDLDAFILNHSRLQISNSYDITNRYKNDRVKFVGNRFFRNDSGTFVDISDSVGVFGPASNYGLGIAYSDLNEDGWTDVYVSNDYTEKDKLLINEDGHRFTEHGLKSLSHISQFSMGVDIADINNDGLLDIVTLDMLPESNQRQKEFFWPDRYDVYASMVKSGLHHQYMRNMLHLNRGDGTFSEIGQLAGIAATEWSWAPLLADYDNDGLQDLFITNGFKRNFTSNDFLRYQADLLLKAQKGERIDKVADILSKMPANSVHNYLYHNQNGLQFMDRSSDWGFAEGNLSNGAAYADLDNDGDLDLVVNNLDAPASIYKNNSEKLGAHFLTVRLQGNDGNKFGLGAKVTLFCGDSLMTRTLCPYRGFQSSVEPKLFFGLGKNSVIDSLVVQWPRGERQTLKEIKADQHLSVKQQEAKKMSLPPKAVATNASDTIPFKHTENAFIDFKVQPLLPRMYSAQGPALAAGDVNGDGLCDVFLGGAKGQSGQLFIQTKNGAYKPSTFPVDKQSVESEDVDAVLFDMDNDNDLDLYVVSGGYEFDTTDVALLDRLYRNDGKGNFRAVKLPEMFTSGSCARAGDADSDGDLDLFVGGRIVPGRYPATPKSYLLINDGTGNFTDETRVLCPALDTVGLVTDGVWVDLNKDRLVDLVIVGEWMSPRIFIQRNGRLDDQTDQYGIGSITGWWNCIRALDIDGDGDDDVVAGNFGLNNLLRPDSIRPVSLYYSDFDRNGSLDPLMEYFIHDNLYPMPTRDELTDQLPLLKKRFNDYQSYTNATIRSILTPGELAEARVLKASTFASCLFENAGGVFRKRMLPLEIQFAPVNTILTGDFNGDKKVDLFLGGNLSTMGARFGKATGLPPTFLLGDGEGGFETVNLNLGITNKDLMKAERCEGRIIGAFNNGSPILIDLHDLQKK